MRATGSIICKGKKRRHVMALGTNCRALLVMALAVSSIARGTNLRHRILIVCKLWLGGTKVKTGEWGLRRPVGFGAIFNARVFGEGECRGKNESSAWYTKESPSGGIRPIPVSINESRVSCRTAMSD